VISLYADCCFSELASDKVYQLLAHGRWFSLGTPASSTTKSGCHDIIENVLTWQQQSPARTIQRQSKLM